MFLAPAGSFFPARAPPNFAPPSIAGLKSGVTFRVCVRVFILGMSFCAIGIRRRRLSGLREFCGGLQRSPYSVSTLIMPRAAVIVTGSLSVLFIISLT